MDDNDSLRLAVTQIVEAANLPFINNISLVCSMRINSRQNIHQRRFSSTVLTAKRVDLSAFYLQINIVECLDTAEFFGNMIHFQNII